MDMGEFGVRVLALPRFQTRNSEGDSLRRRSPSGGSTFNTRAPLSATITPAIDAGTVPDPSSSTTRSSQIMFAIATFDRI
jgi:hypothetical protein